MLTRGKNLMLVSLAFANESLHEKSVKTVRASTYEEYFSQKIFVIGSKMKELGLACEHVHQPLRMLSHAGYGETA